jgi:hypothetical protein
MIITGKKEVSWKWMFISVLPWSSQYLEGLAMGAAFFFSLRKFIDNPAGLTFILSLPPFVGLLMGPITHFLSDRIWTRYGRRKPFIIASWCGTLTAMAVMPLMPTFIGLLGAYLVFIFFNTMGGPVETLKQEVVPPKQRVTTAAILTWINQFVMLFFYLIAIGRFDDEGYLAGLPVSGEESIYWAASLSSLIMILLVMLGIKETNPHSSLVGKRLGIRDFFTSILHRNLRQVYVLIFGAAVYNVGTGAIGALLYIEQWQFTKQELGTNVAVGGALNLVIIFILGLFAKKLPRMKTYQALLVIGMVLNISFYLYVHLFIYDQRPTLLEVIIFGEMLAIVGTLKSMIYTPLVYDYVPRNEMGTYAAGASIINRLVNILLLNGAGLFVIMYSKLFLPQGGEMVRVSFPEMMHEQQVMEIVRHEEWIREDNGLPYDAGDIYALPWYGNGAALDQGRTFEIVFRNKDSENLFEERKDLRQKNNRITAKAANARALAIIAERDGDLRRTARLRAEAEEYDRESAPLQEKIDDITAELDRRAEATKQQVLEKLDGHIMDSGSQILEAASVPALTFDWPLSGPPNSRAIEKGLDRIRDVFPDIIDMRPRKEGNDYKLRFSYVLPDGTDADGHTQTLHEVIEAKFAERLKDVWLENGKPEATQTEAIRFRVRIVEDPLDQHPSPIMRATYALISLVTEPPKPERRVYGFARNLRSPELSRHIRVLPDGDHSIEITALAHANGEWDKPEPPRAVMDRLAAFLDDPESVDLALRVYQRAVELGESNHLNITRPYIENTFAERQYDYMSSYIWMLVLDAIGIAITIVFVSREKRGLIHKRGIEEMEAST